MKIFRIIAFALIPALATIACGPSLLKDWVKERRGYKYYSDYSTMPILGDVKKGGSLERNPYFVAVPDESELPERTLEKNASVFLRGSLNIAKFLKKITGGNIKGDFSSAYKAVMSLKQSFKEEARTFIPIGSCLDETMRVVIKTLNVGDMEIRIENNREENITASFGTAVDAGGGQGVKFGKNIEIKGKKFYVGYYSENFHCRRTGEKKLVLIRGAGVYDQELGLLSVKYLDSRKEGFDRHALLYISPSNFAEDSETARDGASEKSSSESLAWERAAKPRDGAIRLEHSDYVQVKEGTKIGVAAIPMISGIYMEVISVDEDKTTLRVQHMRYDFKNPPEINSPTL